MRELQIQNTLTGKKEKFVPANPDSVKAYSCGPTVYGYTHVGNARAALVVDLVTKTLEYFGYKVELARNFTDVDDKIINVAQKEGVSSLEISEKFTKAYLDDLSLLKTRAPNHMPKVTESMKEILGFIEGLITKGFAYTLKTDDGVDVYYAVEKFKSYGKLSHRKLDDLLTGSRAEVEAGKHHEADFALWKAAKKGEPSWDSPWGPGRPGWHIECSAMIHRLFQEPIDIHFGGLDLIFPHHENEIAQSEAFVGKPLAKYWLHNGMLEFGNEKMSKSLGNIVRTKDFLDQRHPEVLRMLFLQQHYRSPLDFSDDNVERAEAMLERLYVAMSEAAAFKPTEPSPLVSEIEKSLADDFNSAKALGHIFKTVRNCFRDKRPEDWSELNATKAILSRVFGIFTEAPAQFLKSLRAMKLKRLGITEQRSQEIENRLAEREKSRAQKDFAASDRIRAELEADGVMVMDGPDGTAWTLKGSAS